MQEGYTIIPAGDDPLDYLDNGYILMNYKYVLEGPALSTYHRDVTSSKTVFKTRHPTYTFFKYN